LGLVGASTDTGGYPGEIRPTRSIPGKTGTWAEEARLLVGLEAPETAEPRRRLDRPVLGFETPPRYQTPGNSLYRTRRAYSL
jgi:hypothetical protein